MALDKIVIKGAREHNLKNIDIEIPRDKIAKLRAEDERARPSRLPK